MNQRGTTLIELQIVGVISVIVGGISLFTLIKNKSMYDLGEKMSDLQFSCTNTMNKLVEDIRLAGYSMPEGDTAFTSAKEKELTLLSDLDNNGTVDTFRYYLGTPSSLPNTPNPNDCILYKAKKGTSPGIRIGSFTSFTLGYFDGGGNDLLTLVGGEKIVTALNLPKIRLITVTLKGEFKKADQDGKYQKFELKSSINPRNLILLASD